MPNFLAALKEEITRLSRKELRKHVDPIKKSSAAHRRQIAALKRQIAKLERTVSALSRRSSRNEAAAPAAGDERPQRFVAKGLRSLRARLGLSAADFAALVGVSGQSIYNWETGKAAPRREQLTALAALRGIGKREALAKLEQSRPAGGKARRADPAADKPAKKARRKTVAKQVAKPARRGPRAAKTAKTAKAAPRKARKPDAKRARTAPGRAAAEAAAT